MTIFTSQGGTQLLFEDGLLNVMEIGCEVMRATLELTYFINLIELFIHL